MLLKRRFDPDALAAWETRRRAAVDGVVAATVKVSGLDADIVRRALEQKFADENGLPTITHVDALHASKTWRPSTGIVERGIAEGWLAIADGRLSVRTAPGTDDVVYRIIRGPGRYCCHCGSTVGSEREARTHVATHDAASPDPNNPAGYLNAAYYECVLEGSSNG